MIRAICIPVRLVDLHDLEARLRLLEGTLNSMIPWGIEVIGPLTDFTNKYLAERIMRNAEFARKMGVQVITMHAPVTRGNYWSASTNLSLHCARKLKRMLNVGFLAGEIGAEVLTFHAEVFMNRKRFRNLKDIERKRLLEAVGENLSEIAFQNPDVQINAENMPAPLMGDVFLHAKDMIYDPFFGSSIAELVDFCEKYQLGVTLNTSHWALRPGVRTGGGLLDSLRLLKKRLNHVHLSDATGKWENGKSLFVGGVVPGEGKLGDALGKFVRCLKKDLRPFVLTLKVNDKDMRLLSESRRGMRWLMTQLVG